MGYKNPIIGGFNPDPSICRVGADYYLVTSTFEYFPGIPVYHSKDLVNWEHISNAVSRFEQLPMAKAKASGGIWAPTIRFDGTLFYITATFDGVGNFIIHTGNPYGQWSDAVFCDMDGIDPSMLFHNGKMYYCANDCGSRDRHDGTEGISVAEMNPLTGRVKGEIRRVWTGAGGGWLEAPHIYRIGDMYYILAAEGGTGAGHHEIAARSRSIWGPYENCPYNPVLTNRNDTTKQAGCCGHADLFEDGNGAWWMAHLGTRPYTSGKSPLGRETFLTPVNWIDGWPVAVGKRAYIENDVGHITAYRAEKKPVFDFKADKWEPDWIFVKNRRDQNIRRGGGTLILKPSTVKINNSDGVPVFAAIRQKEFECEFEAELDFEPMQDGDEAGIAAYLTPLYNYRIGKRRDMGEDYVVVTTQAEDFVQEIFRSKAPGGRIKFAIRCSRENYEFTYSANGKTETAGKALAKFLTPETASRCFTGTVIGIYAQADRDTGARAVVYRFAER